MRKQRTFYGSSAFFSANEFITAIKNIFELKSAKITRLKPHYDWNDPNYRVEVMFK